MLTPAILEALIYAGCFDEFGKNRATLIASMPAVLQFSSLIGNDERGINLFTADDDFVQTMKPRYKEQDEYPEKEKLALEKEYTGQYVSAHPVMRYHTKMKKLGMVPLAELATRKTALIGAYLLSVKVIRTKKGENMCFLNLSDDSGELSAVAFPEVYRNFNPLFETGNLLALQVKLDKRGGERQAIIERAERLEVVEVPKRLFLKVANEAQTEQIKVFFASVAWKF